jgi:hypothetical protein
MAQGHSNTRIARELVVTERAVERNIAFIFDSLGLPPAPDNHRRVLAVVQYLNRDACRLLCRVRRDRQARGRSGLPVGADGVDTADS